MQESLIFGSPTSLGLAATLFLVGLILIVIRGRRQQMSGFAGWLAPVCKSLGFLLLALCLLEPLSTGHRVRPGANLFLILADKSQSLTIKDPGESAHRGEQFKELLDQDKNHWQVRLAQDFDVRRYQFDAGLQNVADFAGLQFSGDQSNLIAVLNGFKDRFRNRPVAGILLFTDGIASDVRHHEFRAQGLPPIYPVVTSTASRAQQLPDLSIAHVSVTTTAFEDAPVTIQADVTQSALPRSKVRAQLIDESGTVVKEETQTFPGDQSPLPFRFQVRPTKTGILFYEIRVRTEEEAQRSPTSAQTDQPRSGGRFAEPMTDASSVEATLANNRRLITLDRGRAKYRVLYLAGRPNWEFKFLKRAIDADEQVELTGIIRIAKKEPKFDWRSKQGESSNPLFKGFDGKSEDTERYDQPVLVRLNTKTPEELRDGFPKQAEELYDFHAVIIDDLEAEFFSPDQLSLLERFVSERGGGLLLLGGTESFRNGGYEKTPIGRMSPVYLDHAATEVKSGGYRLALTREGWLQPWARLRSTETEEQQRISELPNFQTLNRTGRLKPGATVIAEALDSGGERFSALAVQSFGRGRCAGLMIGDLWRWQLDRTDVQREKDDLAKAWRQTVRWLIADVPDRIEVQTALNDEIGQPLTRIEARVRNKSFQTQDNAIVNMTVQLPDGTSVTQTAEPSLREAGLYEATFASRQSGCYRGQVEVQDMNGQPLGKAETGWVADPAADEFARVSPNIDFLKQIAKQTSGEVIAADRLESFARSLPHREAPLTETYANPVWHQPWMFVIILGLFCMEWAMRRWKGLP